MLDFEAGTSLKSSTIRTNPAYQLRCIDQLDAPLRAAVGNLAREDDFFGVLVPPDGSQLPMRAVSRDLALLLLTIRQACPVPRLLESLFGKNTNLQLWSLIQDGIVQIIDGEGPISVKQAFAQFAPIADQPPISQVVQLSRRAIEYAVSLPDLAPHELATRLYIYNTLPLTKTIARQLADWRQVLDHVANARGIEARLRACWPVFSSDESWIRWHSGDTGEILRFKLYISPVLGDLPRTFKHAIEILKCWRCRSFKIGSNGQNLLRPDKFVAYFANFEDLYAAACLIEEILPSVMVHGVPFTGSIESLGLTSWGMDPPEDFPVSEQNKKSWRQWICERLAAHIHGARQEGILQLVNFVITRLHADGVDTSSWSPSLSHWNNCVR